MLCSWVGQRVWGSPTLDESWRVHAAAICFRNSAQGWVFQDEWLGVVGVEEWAYVESGLVKCRFCRAKMLKSKLTQGKPTSDLWRFQQLTQHASGQKHKEAGRGYTQVLKDAHAIKSQRLEILAGLHMSLMVIHPTCLLALS